MPDRTSFPITGAELRRHALEARAGRDRAAAEAADQRRRDQRARALHDLHRELELLGIEFDDAGSAIEWADERPTAVVDGLRFRIEEGYDCGPYAHLLAAIVRQPCRHEVVGIIGLHGRETAWADLGDLIARAEESFQRPCRQCMEEAADQVAGGDPLAPLPTLGQRLEHLLREIVRQEIVE